MAVEVHAPSQPVLVVGVLVALLAIIYYFLAGPTRILHFSRPRSSHPRNLPNTRGALAEQFYYILIYGPQGQTYPNYRKHKVQTGPQ